MASSGLMGSQRVLAQKCGTDRGPTCLLYLWGAETADNLGRWGEGFSATVAPHAALMGSKLSAMSPLLPRSSSLDSAGGVLALSPPSIWVGKSSRLQMDLLL